MPVAQLALDENYRPVTGNIAIDAGSTEYLVTPTVLATETAEKLDFAKGRRIYNGAVDIGAGEFDWRGVFGAKLRPGDARAQVLAASENVTTNVLDGIVLNGGDSVGGVCGADAGSSHLHVQGRGDGRRHGGGAIGR